MLIDFINIIDIKIEMEKPTPSTCSEHNVNRYNKIMKFFDKWGDFMPQSKKASDDSVDNSVRNARQTIIKAFADDPSFRESYVANIACAIMDYDERFARDSKARNELASLILDKIFKN
jgi:hypothetical protein